MGVSDIILSPLVIKDCTIPFPVICGGMGIGVTRKRIVRAVWKEDGLGAISTAAMDRLRPMKNGQRPTTEEAVYDEVSEAKENGGCAAVNVMEALYQDRDAAVRGALAAKVDIIIAGAGLHLNLPAVAPMGDTALVPIVSSADALRAICLRWGRLKYRPDAVILEGPLAGGHLGFKLDEIDNPEFSLGALFPKVKEIAIKFGDFPVIVAGGIFTREDIVYWIDKMGANGVQMGTRFLATEESGASRACKEAVVRVVKKGIFVAGNPGSPCGFPFRVIALSPMFLATQKGLRTPRCDKGYVRQRDTEGGYKICPAFSDPRNNFCICNGLLSSCDNNPEEEPLYTVGAKAYLVDRIVTVKELMNELKGRRV